MRWLHQGIDRLQVALIGRFMPYAFRDGVESPAFAEHVAAITLTLPALSAPGRYPLSAHTLVGEVEASVQLWPGPQSPPAGGGVSPRCGRNSCPQKLLGDFSEPTSALGACGVGAGSLPSLLA